MHEKCTPTLKQTIIKADPGRFFPKLDYLDQMQMDQEALMALSGLWGNLHERCLFDAEKSIPIAGSSSVDSCGRTLKDPTLGWCSQAISTDHNWLQKNTQAHVRKRMHTITCTCNQSLRVRYLGRCVSQTVARSEV